MLQITSWMRQAILNNNVLSMLLKYLVAAFAVISILVLFIPFNPGMPHSGLDPSWQYSMNEAVAQHLNIGTDIIFTFGPYASIYTHLYHPATDHLMIFGCLFLGLCYAASLLYLAKDKAPYFLLALLVFMVVFMTTRDPLYLSYPLILMAGASRYMTEADSHEKMNPNPWQILAIALIFAPLGLLGLVKGSLILICGATAVVIATYFLYRGYRKLALIVFISPLVSTAIFWVLSGQSLLFLPNYFASVSQIASGYSEAMALSGIDNIEIPAYLLAAIAIIWTLLNSDKAAVPTKVFLSTGFALYLFIAFKSGFVRHDGHALIAGSALVIAVLILGIISTDKRLIIALLLSIMVWAYIDISYHDRPIRKTFENIQHFEFSDTYAGALYGLYCRIKVSNNLHNRFVRSLAEIRKENAIPALQGTTDIYPHDQAYILASNNKWNPRPVIQSYSAYTPKLAQINEQHLRGSDAPDNVLFSVKPLEHILPSLEDGLSWPALFDNYTVTRFDNQFAYLRKNQSMKSSSAFDIIYQGTHKAGEIVTLPMSNAPIYAEIDINPTLLGKLLGGVFKPPQLQLALKLEDGSTKDYRVASTRIRSGFFISPFIHDTKSFIFLVTENLRFLKNLKVETISLMPAYGGSLFWGDTYALKLKAYRGEGVTVMPEISLDSIIDSIPEGYVETQPVKCEGSIDVVNNVNNILSVEGWLAVSTKDLMVPDETFITLKQSDEATKYIKTHSKQRYDVNAGFRQPEMPNLGYSTIVDVTGLNGQYVLGFARGFRGELVQCQQFVTLTMGVVN